VSTYFYWGVALSILTINSHSISSKSVSTAHVNPCYMLTQPSSCLLEQAVVGQNYPYGYGPSRIDWQLNRNCFNSDKIAEVSYASMSIKPPIMFHCVDSFSHPRKGLPRAEVSKQLGDAWASGLPSKGSFTLSHLRNQSLTLFRFSALAMVRWEAKSRNFRLLIIRWRCVVVSRMQSTLVSQKQILALLYSDHWPTLQVFSLRGSVRTFVTSSDVGTRNMIEALGTPSSKIPIIATTTAILTLRKISTLLHSMDR